MTRPNTEATRQNRAFWDGFLCGVIFTAAFVLVCVLWSAWVR